MACPASVCSSRTFIRRHVPRVLGALMLLACVLDLQGQQVPPNALDTTPVSHATHKSPATAALIAAVLPGAGHWYAKENNRGWLVAAVYFTGFLVTYSGRTDDVGKVGGVALVGAWTFAVIDGALAAKRYNRRSSAQQTPTGGR